jgi:hypothetical protein
LKLLQNILASPLKFLWNGIFQRALASCPCVATGNKTLILKYTKY